MQSPAGTNSFLILQFRQFHRELLHILACIQGIHPASGQNQQLESSALSSEEVMQRLLSLMSVQALESGQERTPDRHDLYREAQYVMAALADELILSIDWPGRSTWPLLERQLFYTHASGEIFFKRLDEILRRPMTAYSDLEHIYLYALSLGFRGKYRDRDDHGQLAQYRQKLYLRIYQRPAQALIPDQQLFPQSYGFTLEEYSSRRMPGPRIWILCLIVILGLWIAASDALWRNATRDVSAQIKHIQQNESHLDRLSHIGTEDKAITKEGGQQ